jgi:hypothetical protein
MPTTVKETWKTRGRKSREIPIEYLRFEDVTDILSYDNDGGTKLVAIVNEHYINKAKEIVSAEDAVDEAYLSLAKAYMRKLKKLGREISEADAVAKVKQLELLA